MYKYLLLCLSVFFCAASYAQKNPAVTAMEEYLEFANYAEGIISIQQLQSIETKKLLYIDTRKKNQYDTAHIPDAINIEWRAILARRDEIPDNKVVILYCDTGLLSAKAHFALQLAGREKIKVLQGGYQRWNAENTGKQ